MANERQQQGRPAAKSQPSPAQDSRLAQMSESQKAIVNLGKLIESRRESIQALLGKHFDASRLVKLGQMAITRNPKLAQCNVGTVLLCMMRCAELNLEPDAALPQRRMWLVPRKNNRLKEGLECTYVIDFRAKMQAARDTGLVPFITSDVIYEKDVFEYAKSAEGETTTKFRHVPQALVPESKRGAKVGYYAIARLDNGQLVAEVWPLERMEAFRARHDSAHGDAKAPWAKDFDAMARKTMCNQLFSYLPAGESPQARRLQEITAEENAIEVEGRTLGAGDEAVPVELVPEGLGDTTDAEVEAALAGGKAAGAKPQDPNDEFGLKAEERQQSNEREPGEEG